MLTKELEPFKIRGGCAMNIWRLGEGFPRRAGSQYPQPDRWNDTVVVILDYFRCPGVPEAKCTYAMNPDCEPNSPPDVVLLFETDAGWNRYGGPELFSFEHHNPRGGCVLLNDHRTVRFIRTEDELRQLRWK
jgi:hypothetical protein